MTFYCYFYRALAILALVGFLISWIHIPGLGQEIALAALAVGSNALAYHFRKDN